MFRRTLLTISCLALTLLPVPAMGSGVSTEAEPRAELSDDGTTLQQLSAAAPSRGR